MDPSSPAYAEKQQPLDGPWPDSEIRLGDDASGTDHQGAAQRTKRRTVRSLVAKLFLSLCTLCWVLFTGTILLDIGTKLLDDLLFLLRPSAGDFDFDFGVQRALDDVGS